MSSRPPCIIELLKNKKNLIKLIKNTHFFIIKMIVVIIGSGNCVSLIKLDLVVFITCAFFPPTFKMQLHLILSLDIILAYYISVINDYTNKLYKDRTKICNKIM